MTLPEHLIKSALLGTAKQPFLSDTLSKNPNPQSEADLLLTVATTRLHEQAGFVPKQQHRPLSKPCPDEFTVPCSEKSMRHLHLLISGTHGYALKEWLIEANKAGVHVKPDTLPNLLLLGLKREDLRPYLLPIIGERGKWLATEINNQNWKWVFEPVDVLMEIEGNLKAAHEKEVIEKIRSRSLEMWITEFPFWIRYRRVWSEELTEAFLLNLEKVRSPQWSGVWWVNNLTTMLTPLVYFFPLHLRSGIEQRLKSIRLFQGDGVEWLDTVRVIYDFRQDMIDALNEREE